MKRYTKIFPGLILFLVMMLGTVCTAKADDKALGIGAIRNPTPGSGSSTGWVGDKVYFGSKNNLIKFNVLQINETGFGGKTLFLDSESILDGRAFDNDSNIWRDSDIKRWLNNDFMNERFTDAEISAIFSSTKTATTGISISTTNENVTLNGVPLEGEKIFLLDAGEVTNTDYGFENTTGPGNTRVKWLNESSSGDWWRLRSPVGSGHYVGCVYGDGGLNYDRVTTAGIGVSPALNINLSSVIFATRVSGTAGHSGAEYKLTIKDSSMAVTIKDEKIIREGTKIIVPYTLTGSADQMSVVMTEGEWSDDTGWSTTAEPKYYGKLDDTKSFTLPAAYHPDWNTYIIAEKYNSGNQTDYAGKPVKITIPTANTARQTFEVTFKVVNGEWNQGGCGNQTVSLSRYVNEDLLLKLDESDIPGAGNKPDYGFMEGSWDTAPDTERAISRDITYTYTYAEKPKLSATVTFKVVNGLWDDGGNKDKTVTLNGHEGDTLKLSADQIPSAGRKPNDTYKAGSWDETPDTATAITGKKTYTYTYARKGTVSTTVSFKVVNGSWDDGTADDKSVTLSGYEGDKLKLTTDQIPAVGKNPNDGYKSGAWDKTPSTKTVIKSNTIYTYQFIKKEPEPKPKENADIALNAGLKLNWSGSKITFTYGAVKGAAGYDIYAAYCGTKNYKKIATEKGCSTTIKKLNGKKLRKNRVVKLYVVARNGDKTLAKSLPVHVAGPKCRYTYAKKIRISKKSYELKKGKTVKLKPQFVRRNKKKKRLPDRHAPKFRYATSDNSVATVDQNGKVKTVGKGTCDVYIYAVNGMPQKVKVTVK